VTSFPQDTQPSICATRYKDTSSSSSPSSASTDAKTVCPKSLPSGSQDGSSDTVYQACMWGWRQAIACQKNWAKDTSKKWVNVTMNAMTCGSRYLITGEPQPWTMPGGGPVPS